MRIRSGDMVEVRSGNARGTRAKVLAVKPARGPAAGPRLVVEGVNRVYRHIRRSQKNPQGGRLSKEMPIDASNVLFVCPACGKAVRLGVKTSADGSKVRVCRGCGAEHGLLGRAKAVAKTANIKAGR
jgi:large subunit ribosomal protein L24